MAIVSELASLAGKLEVQFASYSTGAETLRRAGWPVIDMDLPESNGFLPTLFKARQVIGQIQPQVVVSHEEFAVVPAAKLAGIPSIYVSDWFPPSGNVAAESVALAESIIFIEDPGLFALPDPAAQKPIYVGPVVRPMAYSRADRARARAELGIAEAATLVAVVPGAWATEERAPVADLVISAFRKLKFTDKHLFWLTKRDYDSLCNRSRETAGVTIMPDYEPTERILVASDVVITKGNRGSIMEAASLGIPSISLSYALNPIDDVLVARIRSNTALNAKAVDGEILAQAIEQLASLEPDQRPKPLDLHQRGGREAAKVLASEIERLVT